jgi:hypothetical protein
MESETNAALATTTTSDIEHLNLADIDPKYIKLNELRALPLARQQHCTSTNNNTHTTKRTNLKQTPPPVIHPTVAPRNQRATSRSLESSYITNGHTCNADVWRRRNHLDIWRRQIWTST